ncbi:DUF5659 domain-containing protein [Candidatus Clostridium stratigraminis]|uniref:DUF5659 domain-containing protein n=1 Tax=Candidatus Clostridium stratigraminis TaxID=3381661 RepID=A0ABW8T7G3_9CLOT
MGKKYYLCLSQRQAGFLMLKGFKLLKIQASEKDTNKNVFYFPFTEEVMKEVTLYNELRKNKGVTLGV